ncbi:MAG: hypothetical protein R3A48_19265 [Polyangiales bacterium]
MSALEPVRIPLKPQTKLFATNLVVQPPLAGLFLWMALSDESRGTRVFGALFAVIAVTLFAFSALALHRVRGKTFEAVVTDVDATIPIPLRGNEIRFALKDVKEARVVETKTATRSFWMLTLRWDEGGETKSTVVASQFVGDEAFFALRDALAARGVALS